MSKKPLRRYLSCYSCKDSTITMDGNKRVIYCELSQAYVELKRGMAFPEWCEIFKTIRKSKRANN